jgi:hypothetical protein
MNDDLHDDGLVHGHSWASEPPPSIGEMLRTAPLAARPQAAPAVAAPPPQPAHEPHDDGLVHHHGWACGVRGAMGFAAG